MSIESLAPHPVLACVDGIADSLQQARGSDPLFLSDAEKRRALLDFTRLGDQLESLRMRVIESAELAAADEGFRSAASWLAARTRTGYGQQRRAQHLAEAVAQRWQLVGAALEAGRMHVVQAQVIVKALEALPGHEVPAEVMRRAEAHLVQLAEVHDPRRLEVLGEKILEVVAPEQYDDLERKALERAQRRANAATRLSFSRRGDGATDLKARIPDHVASRLKTMLEAWTSPRHDANSPGPGWHVDPATGVRLTSERLLGEAFRSLLEAADPSRLPIHGGGATRVVVTIDLEALKTGVGQGTLLTSGDDLVRITAEEARRLACQADIIPAVLGGRSHVLDLGRSRRFFDGPQRLAKMVQHPVCQAQGCTIPSQWCEAHHGRDPWSRGGQTDLDDLELLCPWHHQRAHDPAFRVDRLANGDVRFARRT